MEQAGQAGRGQPGTASPWMMTEVWGQAGKPIHESGAVHERGPQPSTGMAVM